MGGGRWVKAGYGGGKGASYWEKGTRGGWKGGTSRSRGGTSRSGAQWKQVTTFDAFLEAALSNNS